MLRRHPGPLFVAGTALALTVLTVLVLAAVTGVSLHRVFSDLHPSWIVVVAIAAAAGYLPYVVAYRQQAVTAGLSPPRLLTIVTVVLSGFGPFVPGGGFHRDRQVLAELYGDEQTARVEVSALVALEWAVLAPLVWLGALVVLIDGTHDVMGSLPVAWLIGAPAGFALGLWLSAPGHRRFRDHLPATVVAALDGMGIVHRMIRSPVRSSPAWLGMLAYWVAEMAALYAAARVFGAGLSAPRIALAYGTGYIVTRRSLPLAGAAVTEVLLTYALHWTGAQLGRALAAVVVYRLVGLLLISVPALLAERRLAAHPPS